MVEPVCSLSALLPVGTCSPLCVLVLLLGEHICHVLSVFTDVELQKLVTVAIGAKCFVPSGSEVYKELQVRAQRGSS